MGTYIVRTYLRYVLRVIKTHRFGVIGQTDHGPVTGLRKWSRGKLGKSESRKTRKKVVTVRLMVAMEKQVDISQERARQLGLNQKIQNIKAILDESGDFLDDNEKQAMRKKLFELRMQCIKDGEDGSGV